MSKKVKKEEQLKPVYLITGSDTPKVEKAVRRLRERITSESGTDINVDLFDALDHHASQVIQSANTLPFGEGLRLVIVLNAGAWRKSDKDEMAAFLSDPPEYACLALVGGGIRKNEGLYRAVEARGQVLAFEAPRPADFPKWTQEQAVLRRLKMGSREAARLVTLTAADPQAIITELEKLAAYAGQGAVEMTDIDALCWVTPEVRVWDLTDALGAKNRTAVFTQVEALLAQKTAPGSVFYSLAKHLKCLSEVVAAKERGQDAAGAAAAMGLKPFPARKIVEQSRNFTGEGLRQAISIFSDLDADMKGRSGLSPEFALEAALARVLDVV